MPSPATQPIVDTHQHLWDLDRFSLPWTKNEKLLAHNFVMSDYFKATEELNISQTVYMEVDLEPKQQEAEARYVIELCERDDNPMTAAVISGRPAHEGFGEYLAKFQSNPQIKGLRQVLHVASTPQGYCLDPKFVRGVQLLGDRGLCYDLCMRSGELLDADKLVAQCPRTRFIVDHCGNMNVEEKDDEKRKAWKLGMQHLADHDNVVCKVSGIVASAAEKWTAADLKPTIEFTLKTFGPDRVMFGGDWPVCTLRATYRAWVAALQEIVKDRSAEERQKLFHDNAIKFYGLPPQGKKWQRPK